jgi:hypothetical protein
MQNYTNLKLQYQNPGATKTTTTNFELGQTVVLSSDEIYVSGKITKIYRDEEEEQEYCNPQCYHFLVEDDNGKTHTISYNMFPADEVDPQWFYNENYYTETNNSVLVSPNNLILS